MVHILIMGSVLKEHRYMLPFYPALAILSAYALSKIKNLLSVRLGPKQILLPEIIIIIFLILSAVWSIPIGINPALINKSLILEPF